MPEQSIEGLAAFIERQDDEADRALQLLYGELPAWFPLPRLEHARRIVCQLGNKGFTAEQIAKFVNDEISDDEKLEAGEMVRRFVPGTVRDSGAFIYAVNELAHIKYALTLPDNECLEMLAGTLAATGKTFREGRKVNSVGPIRKAIAREVRKNPSLMPRYLWAILARKPPKGWEFFDNSEGKYIEGPKGGQGMKYVHFSAVCKEEKDKLSM